MNNLIDIILAVLVGLMYLAGVLAALYALAWVFLGTTRYGMHLLTRDEPLIAGQVWEGKHGTLRITWLSEGLVGWSSIRAASTMSSHDSTAEWKARVRRDRMFLLPESEWANFVR